MQNKVKELRDELEAAVRVAIVAEKQYRLTRSAESMSAARAAGAEFDQILQAAWVIAAEQGSQASADRICKDLIADVEFLTGFHIVWP